MMLAAAAAAVMSSSSSVVRVPLVVVVVVVVVAQQEAPLTCWSCSASMHEAGGEECRDLDAENRTLTKTCSPEEVYCMVNQIRYVVENEVVPRNFSVNRTCVNTCSPSCLLIGDRTKIRSCTSCCTTSYCNIGSSVSAQPTACSPLLGAALLLVAWLGRPSHTLQPPPPG